MATFTDPGAFAKHIAGYGKKIEGAGGKALKAAALAATRDIRDEGSRFHIGKKRLGAGFKIAGDTAVITPNNPGAWKLIEEGAKPHPIGPRGRGRGRGRRAVVVPGRGVFAHVQHPGTGSIGHPWEKGVARAKRSGPAAFQSEIVKVFT
jgi:hypothetical protein